MNLETRQLGRTGIQTSVLGLGTWGLCDSAYGPVSDAQVTGTLQRAHECGVTTFDMAPTWGPDGRSERAVAEALGTHRDALVYITRAGVTQVDGGVESDYSAAALRSSCEGSLGRLRTDRVDVLLLHHPTPGHLQSGEAADTCHALVQEGKVRAWGASVSDVHAARAAMEAGAQVLCLPHNLVRPELLLTLRNELRSREIGVLAGSPLCHGLLSGRWSAHKGFTPGDHRLRRWTRDALAARIAEMQSLRKRLVQGDVLSLSSAALRFVAAEPCVGSVLLGGRGPGQVELSVHNLGEPPYESRETVDA